jgi:hypothetical protein
LDKLPQGSLRLADLGYFSLEELKQLSKDHVFWLTRIQAMCEVFDVSGNRLNLAGWLTQQVGNTVELQILLGVEAQLPCRLLAQRVSAEVANNRRRQLRKQAKAKGRTPSQKRLALADWNIVATNTAEKQLTLSEAMILQRVRWQIELLFKLWKSHGKIDEWRSEKPWRILCEVYAKLIAMILQHWILLTANWQSPMRSLTKAAKVVKTHALHIASAFATGDFQRLIEALATVQRSLAVGCRIYKRKKRPSTYQLLFDVSCASFSLN